jgi:H+/gluconate symporter-like permease
MPLLLSFLGFGMDLLNDANRLPAWMVTPWNIGEEVTLHSVVDWLRFVGEPTMALLIPTGLAFWCLGLRRGIGPVQLGKIANTALLDVGTMVFLFGAAGGFKEVIVATGAGTFIAETAQQLPLSNVAIAYLVAALLRIALGSATASILAASAVLVSLEGPKTLLVLAVANGVTFMTQPADSGFWLVKEYCNLSVKQVMLYFNSCRVTMSLTGLTILLLVERFGYLFIELFAFLF